MPISAIQNAHLPGSVPDDHGIMLGGIGSDLWHSPGDPPNEFWMLTDRGPNGESKVQGQERRTFPVPEFTPTILKVRADGGTLSLLDAIPIVGPSGAPVTGLSNMEAYDEEPFDYQARIRLPYRPTGLDTEGLVRTSAGEFWVADEYGPSIVHLDARGMVTKRYVPQGVTLSGTDYPVASTLPSVYAKRKPNRGFEGLALSPDEKTLFIGLQSPLANPDEKPLKGSRLTRILAFDLASEQVVGEYIYRFEPVDQFDPSEKGSPDKMKLSALAAVSPTSLLVLERTDGVARVYLANLSQASNVLGSRFDDPSSQPSLETLNDPASAGLAELPKSLVLDLANLPGMPSKLEGVAIVNLTTLAVANDNDFDIGKIDGKGQNVGKGEKSQLLTITLDSPLPMP
jgi:Esterase-like activity of phytase